MPKRSALTLVAGLWPFLLAVSNDLQDGVQFAGTSVADPIGRSLWILEDATGRMTIEQAIAAKDFEHSTEDIPNLGTTNSAYWIRFAFLNSSPSASPILQVLEPDIDELDVFLVDQNGAHRIARAGKMRLIPAEDRYASDMAFTLPVAAGERVMIFIRAKSFKQLQLPIVLLNTPDAMQWHSSKRVFIGGFIGIMLVMALYNLFVYFSIRDRSYLAYVIYIVLVGLTQLSILGMLPLNRWPAGLWLSPKASVLLTVFTAIAASEFMRHFIQVREHLPRLSRATPFFYVLLLASPALDVLGMPLSGYRLAQVVAGLFASYLLIEAGLIARRGSRPAMFFLIAWCLFLTGVIAFILKDVRVLPYGNVTKHLMPVGSVLEVVLLSFGLGDKITILRREKERSQAEALRASLENERIIREQNVMLEQKVDERTHALRESNDHLKRTQTQLVNAEKMASLGQLTAGIAHEINNPVNFITSNIPPLRRNLGEMLEVLQEYRSSGIEDPKLKAIAEREKQLGIDDSISEIADILGSIEEGAGRTAEIVRGLRNFSRLDEGDLKPADINEGLRSTLTVLGPQLRDQLQIEMDLGELPPIECYPGKLNQVFMNMLTNAAQAVRARHPEGGGRVSIATHESGGQVVIVIRDNGVGMTPETMSRMFEPFFTTKNVGEGTGLGLSIAYGLVEKHRGRIEADSVPGEGSEFRVVLPMQQTKAVEQRA